MSMVMFVLRILVIQSKDYRLSVVVISVSVQFIRGNVQLSKKRLLGSSDYHIRLAVFKFIIFTQTF